MALQTGSFNTAAQLAKSKFPFREVATLVNEKLAPGTYTRTWDATNQPSGVYFYRLQAGDFTETRKLVLVR